MHIQIHTNLAKYEAHMKKRRHEILPTYFCTLLIYEQNYTSLLYTQLRIVLLLQLHLFTAVNKLWFTISNIVTFYFLFNTIHQAYRHEDLLNLPKNEFMYIEIYFIKQFDDPFASSVDSDPIRGFGIWVFDKKKVSIDFCTFRQLTQLARRH